MLLMCWPGNWLLPGCGPGCLITELGLLAPLFGRGYSSPPGYSGPPRSITGGRLLPGSLLTILPPPPGGLLDLKLLLLATLGPRPVLTGVPWPPIISSPLTMVFISLMSIGVMALGSTTGWGL